MSRWDAFTERERAWISLALTINLVTCTNLTEHEAEQGNISREEAATRHADEIELTTQLMREIAESMGTDADYSFSADAVATLRTVALGKPRGPVH